jgi:hypothetical protein
MQVKDLADPLVLGLIADCWRRMNDGERAPFADQILIRNGVPPKVVLRKMERLADRGLIEYGVSLRTAWLTEAGRRALADR